MAPRAGRKKGKVSKAKRELAEMVKEHAEDALLTLVEIAKRNFAASARVPLEGTSGCSPLPCFRCHD